MPFTKFANLGQQSLDKLFANDNPKQFMNNIYPLTSPEENRVFNYWWIAHLVDTRIDGFLRTQGHYYSDEAFTAYHYNKHRNYDSLIHEYYDDMLWNGLAALRLYEISGNREALQDAKEVCADLFETGWNQATGGGYAWKRTKINYKNTPVNGPLMILALRLYQIDPQPKYLTNALNILHWMYFTLIEPTTQFVNDGINSRGTNEIDSWKFTYNQGVYIGALVEFYRVTNNRKYLEKAILCAHTAIKVFGSSGILIDDGNSGDGGLFKGILYRYLVQLYQVSHEEFIRDYILNAVQVLVDHNFIADTLMATRNWDQYTQGKPILLSDEIGAVMALEAAAAIE